MFFVYDDNQFFFSKISLNASNTRGHNVRPADNVRNCPHVNCDPRHLFKDRSIRKDRNEFLAPLEDDSAPVHKDDLRSFHGFCLDA